MARENELTLRGSVAERVERLAAESGQAPVEFVASLLPAANAEPEPADWVATSDALNLARQFSRRFGSVETLSNWLQRKASPNGFLVRRKHGFVCRTDLIEVLKAFPPKRERRLKRATGRKN